MTGEPRYEVAVIGAGPAGLMAAEVLARVADVHVTVYDAMPSAGRKLLMAGRGGLNLTHSEALDRFTGRYGARADALRAMIEAFGPDDVRTWAAALGQETFIGSSGRVFPKIMKASGLLRAWLRQLAADGVTFRMRHRWRGRDGSGRHMFAAPEGDVAAGADATVLALGGASWPRLGADGAWVALLEAAGVEVAPLQPANVGFDVAWSEMFRARFEGVPLKRIAVTFEGTTARGEAVVTAGGIEGGAVYAVAAGLRDALIAKGAQTLMLDLKPDLDRQALAELVGRARGKQSMATFLRKVARLAPVATGLLQEQAIARGRPLGALDHGELADAIKGVALTVTGTAPIGKAISSAGGVCFEAVDARLMLKRWPGVFVAGEMLDWEAPTGGYLLQACFATGSAAGHGAAAWLGTECGRSRVARD